METAPLIALLTDFGLADPFSGIMKGVLARIAPGVPIVDISHEIPPADVRHGAVTLWQSFAYFPPGTIFLCVVDPGVGTSRRGLLVQSGGYTFIGPDNGLFTFILKPGSQVWQLQNPAFMLADPSSTFHGRDIFAPAAAHVARGISGDQFGPPVHACFQLPYPALKLTSAGILVGEILHADRFGNVLTSLGRFERQAGQVLLKPWLPDVPEVIFALSECSLWLPDGKKLAWESTYANIKPAACAFVIGSSGLLEIVANNRSAARLLNFTGGEQVRLESNP